MSLGTIRRKPVHRRWVFGGATISLVALLLFVIGTAGGSSLTGSNFEIDTDANLVVNGAAPAIDWLTGGSGTSMRSGVTVKADAPSGSSDDSFGNGTKEDDAVPTVIDGSIPPNKSDLKNFGIYVEKTNSGSFMNLFWTRVQDPSGTTNMDFEFNQSSTVSSNGVTPVRTTGDLLIEYHLDNGGSVATLSLRSWTGSSWGAETALTGNAIGSINTSPIAAAASGGLGSLSARTFGEASINMSAILPSGQCRSFGSAYLKSRSSDAFNSAVKDFIAPLTANITNCGSILVKKTDFNSGAALDGASFSVSPGQPDSNGVPAQSSNLSHVGATGSGLYCIDNLFFGNHTVTETAAPTGYDKANPDHQDFNVTDNGTCASRVANNDPPDLTFRDPPILGAIQITKTAKDKACTGAGVPAGCAGNGSRYLSGVIFEIKNSQGTVVATSTGTNSSGVTCVENLPLATYTVHEQAAPTGYSAAADQTAAVTASGTCSSGAVAKSFVNTPLSKITVSFDSKVDGATTATIQCTGEGSPANLPEGTPKVLDDLAPGSYQCTVVVDP
jgi:hypothetical protein